MTDGMTGKMVDGMKTGEMERETGRKKRILDELRENGFRITNQRKLLIDIILSGECSCCKEIYYEAGCILVLDNQEKVSFSLEDFREAVCEILRKKGYMGREKVETVIWKDAGAAEGIS